MSTNSQKSPDPAALRLSTASPRIALLDEGRHEDWDRFIGSCPEGSFYHLSGWERINREEFGHRSYLLAELDTDDSLIGALPLVLVEGGVFGRILCSVPFLNYGGPCARDPAIALRLIDAARGLAHEQRVKYLELRCNQKWETSLPVSTQKVSVTLDLKPDPQELFESFDREHRKEIRRAQKGGLEVVSGGVELLDEFYGLMEYSWGRLGTPLYRRSYFERVFTEFPAQTRIFVCRKDGEPVGAASTGYFNGTVEGMWLASGPRSRELRVNYAMYWEMIRDACERGFQRFHLGRSTTESGGEQFKKKWNAYVQQLYWYFHLPGGGALPELNVRNPKYKLAIATWQKLPRGITRIIGPWVAKRIP